MDRHGSARARYRGDDPIPSPQKLERIELAIPHAKRIRPDWPPQAGELRGPAGRRPEGPGSGRRGSQCQADRAAGRVRRVNVTTGIYEDT